MSQNNKVSSIQLLCLGTLMGSGLFVGLGNYAILKTAAQDAWVVPILCAILGLIPLWLVSKIMDYQPDLHLFEKTKHLFGKSIGTILNTILCLIIASVLLISVWSISNFASTKYLTETPFTFIGLLFLIPAIYGCMKGIETIARTAQILVYFSVVIVIIIVSSLTNMISLEQLKPMFVGGTSPIITSLLKALCYSFVPFITLLMIPKSKIDDEKNIKKYLFVGYISAMCLLFLVFFVCIGVIGVQVASLYRFPEYYIIKKVTISSAFQNIENFLSIHWIFNIFSVIIMSLYFVKEYLIYLFHIKTNKVRSWVCVLVGVVILVMISHLFSSSTSGLAFMEQQFSLYFGLPVIIIILLVGIFAILKGKCKKQASCL